jgi:hypothetical protein
MPGMPPRHWSLGTVRHGMPGIPGLLVQFPRQPAGPDTETRPRHNRPINEAFGGTAEQEFFREPPGR